MGERYGVYFMPADTSELAGFGTSVLGRTATGEPVAAPADDFPGRAELVATARGYGFHATLRAPFEPLPEVTRDHLVAAMEEVAARLHAIDLEGLAPELVGGFCALLLPGGRSEMQVRALAGTVVDSFEHLRAPLSDADRQRRQPSRLSEREREHLERYGYPYVHDTFRFHMTLSSSLQDPQPYLGWLRHRYATQMSAPCELDRLALAWQPDRLSAFRRIAEVRLCSPG